MHEMLRAASQRDCRDCKSREYDYFTTTLSISPLKNAVKLNEIGQRLAKEYGVEYLISDFKKTNGYKRSTELSKIYGLYRQDYCGCEFSQRQRSKTLLTLDKIWYTLYSTVLNDGKEEIMAQLWEVVSQKRLTS